jgi:iron complex transport system ATP-binding protein
MACNADGLGLSVRGLCWGPDRQRMIIRDISFDVQPGSFLAILGANGAGKSSLLRCLYRVNRPLAGLILLDGRDILSLEHRQFAQMTATVLQEMPGDFPFTVRDVVMTGRLPHRKGIGWTKEDRHEVEHAMEHLDLLLLAKRPFGSLSGGEKQRVQIARALAQEPGLIILDEPTNHLDIRHQLEILAMLKGLGMTVIATMHDMAMASRFADQAIILSGGSMLTSGTPQEALTGSNIRTAFGVEANRHAGRQDALLFDFHTRD